MHFSILLCHASMHCWKDSSGMLRRYSLLDSLHVFKTGPLDDPLELWEKKKVTQNKFRWIGTLFQQGNVLLGQELPDAQGIVGRCIGVVKQPQFALSKLSSLLVHWAKQTQQDLSVDLLIDRLVLWQKLTVDGASHIEECDQHDFDFWLWLSCFLWPQRRQTLPLRALALGFQLVLKNPHLITSDDSSKQVWFILKTLDDVLTNLHVVLLLMIIQQPWHHFCADFPHAQIFSDNLPNTVLFHVQLTCDHSNSQTTSATHNLLFALDVHLSPACWKPPTSGVIFHLLAPLFEPLVPLKNMCLWHCVISIRLLKHFKCLLSRLKISGWFIARCSSFVARYSSENETEKRGVVYKRM